MTKDNLKPVAWMHVMDNTEGIKSNGKGIVSITQKRKHPFGKPGVDFSKSFPVTSTPLYNTPPAAQPAPVQEPVCHICKGTGEMDHGGTYPWGEAINIPCECTAPPAGQRQWVGLTESEVDECYESVMFNPDIEPTRVLVYQAIEAKLKEKNA
jgi:hypothetical protein